MDASIAAKAAIVAEKAAKAALKAADAAELQSQIAKKVAQKARINAGQSITFAQATPEQQDIIRRLFIIGRFGYPNGSHGREVQLRRTSDPSMVWMNYGSRSDLYIEVKGDIVSVNTDKVKVNSQVDFGQHYYSGDVEMVDIRIADLEVSK